MSENPDLGRSIPDERIKLEPYDPTWPEQFKDERVSLNAAIADWIEGGIHHVGSTAVPGTEAKPIIDILVGVRDLVSSGGCFDRLGALGYVYAPYRAEEMHWFCKASPARRTHHLHLVPVHSDRYRDELAFREYLRRHRDVAGKYVALKRELAKQFECDREAYTAGKTDFVRGAVNDALADLSLEG